MLDSEPYGAIFVLPGNAKSVPGMPEKIRQN